MNNNTFVHKYLKPLINKNDTCVDMTVGNGNDTLLLAKLSKYVYGFDNSEKAIRNTSERIKEYQNVRLINDSHDHIDKYDIDNIKLFIFNLGYLPHSYKNTITKKETTLSAFKKAYDLLIKNGYIIITFYIGHPGGKDEYYLLDKYIKEKNLLILDKYRQDKIDSPITYIIKKI